MVSNFVDEREGYLAMTREQHDQASPHFPFQARQVLYLNTVTAKRDTGPVLASCSKWRGQFELLISSIQRAMARDVCGSLITAAATPVFRKML